MAARSLSSTCSLDDQPSGLLDGNAGTLLSRSEALKNKSHEVSDEPRDNHGQMMHEKDHEDKFVSGNERTSNTGISYQQIQLSPTVSFSRSVSQDTTPSILSGTRKTPIRAVFHDLPTAYLSITSGFGRSRSENASGSLQGVRFEESAVSFQNSPVPSTNPDNLFEYASKTCSDNTLSKSRKDEVSNRYITHPISGIPPSDLVGEDKAALLPAIINDTLANPLPSGISDEIFCPIHHPRSPRKSKSLDVGNKAQLSSSCTTPDVATDDDNCKLSRQYLSPQNTASPLISVQDGSTVDNIYRHYAGSCIWGKGSENSTPRPNFDAGCYSSLLSSKNSLALSSKSDGQSKPSALSVRKQRRINRLTSGPPSQPPAYDLPALPALALALDHFPSSAMQHLWQSRSYRDTINQSESSKRSSLAIGKTTLSRSEGRPDLRFQNVDFELGNYSMASVATSKSNNPFRLSSHSKVVMSPFSQANRLCDTDHNIKGISCNRRPLEKEVSLALRRASGFSTFSNGSTSSVHRDEFIKRNSPSFKHSAWHKKTRSVRVPPLEPQNFDNSTQGAVFDAQLFDNNLAVQPDSIYHHQPDVVPVTANLKEALRDIQSELHIDSAVLPLGGPEGAVNDDLEAGMDDWETIGESRHGTDLMDSQETGNLFEVSSIHRTGSSLANMSNDGTTSLYDAEIDEYGSTERITQHAGTIQYSSDYRRQGLSRSPIPTFPPTSREHKVNGYLADLTRRPPPTSPFNYVPKPLRTPHTNPFISPPPETFSTPTARRMLFHKRGYRTRQPNHFPPSSKTADTLKEDEIVKQERGSISSALTPSTLAEREYTYRKLNWHAESPSPVTTLSHLKRQFLSPINPVGRPGRPSSWKHLTELGKGNKTDSYYSDGTPDGEPSTLTLAESAKSDWRDQIQNDSCIEMRRFSEYKWPTNPRENQPLVKGPPGAFYQGIARSQQDNNTSSPDDEGKSRRISSRYSSPKDYPTNVLRPLSLLANRPATPAERERKGYLPVPHQSGYMYRSPHAPPRRLSWQQLYTEAQLKAMQEAASTERVNDKLLAPNIRTSGRRTGEESKYKNRPEALALNQSLPMWTRGSSAHMDLSDKEKKLSNVALLFCVLFPPLLVLFALGRLDKIILWWSKGEVTAFGGRQKKLAQILAAAWGFTIIVGLIIFLVFRFAPSTPAA